ncbi:polyphosphate kinase [Tieghemostelium lacteum]|uniref:ATP-polyphosphate phosphotransferase n=1 Tax=Tieghemostelium lacteum TaxID=361077 RepID=A0A152A285_TIELA|nr:polyphosphate kinase [Tieghemostelium lacteum]|eukprot:KYR00320.1 polyphosphate kinase [Tieghemostelium lacteum]
MTNLIKPIMSDRIIENKNEGKEEHPEGSNGADSFNKKEEYENIKNVPSSISGTTEESDDEHTSTTSSSSGGNQIFGHLPIQNNLIPDAIGIKDYEDEEDTWSIGEDEEDTTESDSNTQFENDLKDTSNTGEKKSKKNKKSKKKKKGSKKSAMSQGKDGKVPTTNPPQQMANELKSSVGIMDKHILTISQGENNLFSPTEFVKSNSLKNQGPNKTPLSHSLLGFSNLGASNLLACQTPQLIPPSATTPLLNSNAPPVTNPLPDVAFCHKILDDQGNFIVPSSESPILDIDNLFNDIVIPGATSDQSSSNSKSSFIGSKEIPKSNVNNSSSTSSSNLNANINNNNNILNNQNQSFSNNNNEIPTELKILQLSGSRIYFNRELSELIYFYRILYEAYNPNLPILEKIRFVAITAQNLDMYFCKRALKLRLGYISTRKLLKPEERYINMVLNTTRNLTNETYNLFVNHLSPELSANNVFILKHDDLMDSEKFQLRGFFLQHVFPLMTPLVVDAGHPFPNLSNLSLNIAVLLQHDEDHNRFVRIKVPQRIPRFVHIKQRSPYSMITMEEIILANLDTLFPNTKIISKSLFRVTRHNDLKLSGEDQANDLLELIKTELHKRKFAPMVRLEVSQSMSSEILDMLKAQLHLDSSEVFIINGPLGLSDLFELCKLNLPHLKFEPWTPHIPRRLVNIAKFQNEDIFSVIRKGELLVNLPYLSFNSSVQFFIESAVKDPKVLAIKIAIYRTNSNSQLIRSLCEAATHKEVSVLVDLKASGDEEQNTKFARLLEQAGCHVSYGLVGLKTHSKIAMVVREEENGLREYLHYSTGNYNASTADIYADMGMFSCDQDLGEDMCNLFNYLTGYSRITSFKKLLIAPMNMRSTLIQLIDNEANFAKQGKEASIYAVMNGLDDKRLVNALYQASIAGVKIKLVVRGRCRILPGIPGLSDNITVISILGRFLEHSRIYCFHNNGQPKAYIASADWLHRNLKRRVEVMVPVEDPENIKELYSIINVYCNDTNAWEMLSDGRYKKISIPISEDSQMTFMKQTIQKHPVIWSK